MSHANLQKAHTFISCWCCFVKTLYSDLVSLEMLMHEPDRSAAKGLEVVLHKEITLGTDMLNFRIKQCQLQFYIIIFIYSIYLSIESK